MECSNEKLAKMILASSFKDRALTEQLWNQIEKYVIRQANKYYVLNESLISESREDFVSIVCQEAFLEMLNAVNTYTDEKGAFLTWYSYHLKNALRTASGIRTPADYNQLIFEKNMLRLDAPIDSDDEATTLLDVLDIEDESADTDFDYIDDYDYQAKLHKLMIAFIQDSLPETRQNIIECRYYKNLPFSQISKMVDIPYSSVTRMHKDSLRTMRRKLTTTEAGKAIIEQIIDANIDYFHNMPMDEILLKREALRRKLLKSGL